MLDLSVVILTYNEEIHIRRCIENVLPVAKDIFIVDSFSNDRTLVIAGEYPQVTVLQNRWENNHAKQFNWGLDNCPIRTTWVLRLDADEYLTPELIEEMREKLSALPEQVTAVELPLRRVFMNRTIKKGGADGYFMLRLFKFGYGRCELRLMDEHMATTGEKVRFAHAFADDNLNTISWWTNKHVGYALREAVDLLNVEYDLLPKTERQDEFLSEQAIAKRRKKLKYAKQPLFWRSFAYFIYRYIFKFGFLDGKEGFLWHFLQGWWYRTLVDAKIFEIKKACGNDREKIIRHLKDVYQIDLLG